MKRMNKATGILFALSILVSFSLCAGGQSENSDPAEKEVKIPVTVFTSILPQKYFVEKIGGNRVQVETLVGPGKSPATYEPSTQQVMDLGEAKILFTIGVPFEKAFLPAIESSLPSLKIVDTSEGIEKRMLAVPKHDGEEEPNDHHGSHANIPDPHIWLSPQLVKRQAKHIYSALAALDPAGEDIYKKGYDSLIRELDEVDAELRTVLAPFKGNTIFVYHPALGYLGDDYGLKQVAIETGGKEPAPSVLEDTIEYARKENVKIIFVQPEFSKASAESIADAIDGAVVTLIPLNPDYINNLRTMAEEIEKAFR